MNEEYAIHLNEDKNIDPEMQVENKMKNMNNEEIKYDTDEVEQNKLVNPFLDNEDLNVFTDVPDLETSDFLLPMLKEPPYSANRKHYVGSPNFALIKRNKDGEQVKNRIMRFAENPLMREKSKESKGNEKEAEISIEGLKGDIMEVDENV